MHRPGVSFRLRERFDDGSQPTPQSVPQSHRHDWYLATDASCCSGTATIGGLAEDASGRLLDRWKTTVPVDDNNTLELLALHYGLDRIAAHVPSSSHIGVLLDHDVLATALARYIGANEHTARPYGSASPHHWAGVKSRIRAFADARVSLVASEQNPAHDVVNPSHLIEPSPELALD